MSTTRDIHIVLRETWGYESFRPGQEAIIGDVLAGKDVVALLPTGGGKSLCYQVPGLAREGVCLVISPLIALMKDQVSQLRKLNINAEALISGMTKSDIDRVLDNAVYGDVKFLYLSPERLRSEIVIERIRRMNVNLLAVDEAHCVSQWGYDFRPPYLLINEIRQYIPDTPVMALTASATPVVIDDLVKQLDLNKPVIHRKSFYRENLVFEVEWTESPEQRVLDSLREMPGTAIIYIRSRKQCTYVATRLVAMGISATAYHAGLERDERDERQARWMSGDTRVMVATNAFGMGIDKSDVRQVIHLELPDSPEAYYQEAGRGGRDGQVARARVFLWPKAETELRERVAGQLPDLEYTQKVYTALANHLQIPIGGGQGEYATLNMPRFCEKYDLDIRPAHQSLLLLDRYGLVKMSEAFKPQSTVYITMSGRNMHTFEAQNPRFAPLLQQLLRWYGGITSGPTDIDERALAATVQLEGQSIQSQLRAMEQMDVLEYRPAAAGQGIEWIIPRVESRYLPISRAELKFRAESANKRMEAMLTFAKHRRECRFSMLLEYFAETPLACGRCDTCAARKQKSGKTGELHQSVMDLLQKPHDLNEIQRALAVFPQKELIKMLGHLLDEGWVVRDRDGKYSANSA